MSSLAFVSTWSVIIELISGCSDLKALNGLSPEYLADVCQLITTTISVVQHRFTYLMIALAFSAECRSKYVSAL